MSPLVPIDCQPRALTGQHGGVLLHTVAAHLGGRGLAGAGRRDGLEGARGQHAALRRRRDERAGAGGRGGAAARQLRDAPPVRPRCADGREAARERVKSRSHSRSARDVARGASRRRRSGRCRLRKPARAAPPRRSMVPEEAHTSVCDPREAARRKWRGNRRGRGVGAGTASAQGTPAPRCGGRVPPFSDHGGGVGHPSASAKTKHWGRIHARGMGYIRGGPLGKPKAAHGQRRADPDAEMQTRSGKTAQSGTEIPQWRLRGRDAENPGSGQLTGTWALRRGGRELILNPGKERRGRGSRNRDQGGQPPDPGRTERATRGRAVRRPWTLSQRAHRYRGNAGRAGLTQRAPRG